MNHRCDCGSLTCKGHSIMVDVNWRQIWLKVKEEHQYGLDTEGLIYPSRDYVRRLIKDLQQLLKELERQG